MTSVSRRLRAPLLLGTTLLLLALISLGTTTWRQPASSANPVSRATIGPFTTGESFGQRFSSEASYLSNVVVRVRARSEAGLPVDAELHFRIFERGTLVRQGVVSLSGLPESSQPVDWSFAPIAASAGGEYELQVVVAAISGGTLVADATTMDTLPGPMLANGIPGGEHIDLVVRPFRELRRTGILMAIGEPLPGGWLVAALFFGGAGGASGIGLRMLRLGRENSAPIDWFVYAILGMAIVSLAASVPIFQFRLVMAAENDPGFILATRGMALAAALVPWIVFVTARTTGRLAELRSSAFASRVFLSAAATTAMGFLLLVVTEEPVYFQWIEIFDGGRPDQGRIPLLQQVGGVSFIRVSLAAWIIFWFLSLSRADPSAAPRSHNL